MEGAAAAATAPSAVSALVGAGQGSRRAPAGEIGTPLIVGSGVDPEVGVIQKRREKSFSVKICRVL